MPVGPFNDETVFNKWMRSRIRGRGYQCIHIREADIPGPLDLLVWDAEYPAWIELKLNDREVEPSQLEFLRAQYREGVRACVVRFWNGTKIFEVSQMGRAGTLGTIFSTGDESKLLDYII